MKRKILLIGQDQIGDIKITELLILCDLADYECVNFRSLRKAWRILEGDDIALVLFNIPKVQKVREALEYVNRKFPYIPAVSILLASRTVSQDLIENGAYYVVDPESLTQVSLTHIILSAIEHKRIENELRTRDGILRAVNYAAEVFLSQLAWESRISDVLARWSSATHSDRIGIYQVEHKMEVGWVCTLSVEWAGKDVTPMKGSSESVEEECLSIDYKRWMEKLEKGEIIFGDVLDLPSAEQSFFLKRDVQSLAVVPIMVDKTWWGFILFERHRSMSKWSPVEIEALKTGANILSAAIARLDGKAGNPHLATHDFLTNLPNRLLLEDRFALAVSRAERTQKKFGIVAIDLDKFKNINDAHGHPFGDKVLIEVAWRLSESVRSSDTCARVGGDEFTVIAEGINNKKDLIRVMEKLSQSLKPVIEIEGKEVHILASMGASIYPNHGTQMEQLMKAADIALYQIKVTYSGFKVYIDEQYSLLKE